MKGLAPGNTKLILFHSSAPLKPLSLAASHRLWLVALVSLFTLASLFTVFTTTTTTTTSAASARRGGGGGSFSSSAHATFSPLPSDLFATLLHYAAFSNNTGKMPDADLHAVAAAVRRLAPCNLLVFGLGHETLLWRSLNRGGRTVFLDESEYYISHFETRHPGAKLEAYDVAYTTRVSELGDLLAGARQQRRGDCRPVQNLLFSDCRLAINDLPNELYDVEWDMILVDGPRGYHPAAPGRMSAVFTAAVLARSTKKEGRSVEVLVHDYEREVERVSSREFLCEENMVSSSRQLAHFVIKSRRGTATAASGSDDEFKFCLRRNNSDSNSNSGAN